MGASLVTNSRSFGNETTCAHAYTGRKWRPTLTDSWLVWLWIASMIYDFSPSYQHAECSWICVFWRPFVSCINDGEYLNRLWVIVEQNHDEKKMAFLLPRTFVFDCLPRCFWTTLWLQSHSKTMAGCLDKLIEPLWLSFGGFCSSIAYIAHPRHLPGYLESQHIHTCRDTHNMRHILLA